MAPSRQARVSNGVSEGGFIVRGVVPELMARPERLAHLPRALKLNMKNTVASLAKTTRPTLHRVLPRKRLFS
ncbi:MAG: hypothetical protein L0Y67_02860, partial [Gammaproteobacteria bacterium]|nr:hypothetical protein [Gammaproteobacteria bacterium]